MHRNIRSPLGKTTLTTTALVMALGLTACGKPTDQPEDPKATGRIAPVGTVEVAPVPAAEAPVAVPVAEESAADETPAIDEAPVAEEIPAAAEAVVAAVAEAVAGAADASKGKTLFATKGCIACHGPKAEGMATFPKLAGQPASDLESFMKAYRAGETRGKQTAIMAPNAKTLTDSEIADIAAYVSGL